MVLYEQTNSYHHPPINPNFFSHTNYFFSVQLGHPKLSGYGLLSTQALQNRSQKYSSVSQSEATAFPWRDPDPPAASRGKGVKIQISIHSKEDPPPYQRTEQHQDSRKHARDHVHSNYHQKLAQRQTNLDEKIQI